MEAEPIDPSREWIPKVQRVVVKIGTAVVTRSDGKVALQRLSAVCEQVKELIEGKDGKDGKEVILVTSGAVGIGKQMLHYQTSLHESFSERLSGNYRPENVDEKACAALGQIRLMSLYKSLFELLNAEAAQLLVTENDFSPGRYPAFRNQISQTVCKLLKSKIVPVFNENDAISTREAPYKDPSDKIFWDNDSLAALLAEALDAKLLIVLSDVEGLYTGPPSNPKSKLVRLYLHQHADTITFGDKSRVGRGGMEKKVEAALYAVAAGVPTVIASGYDKDSVRRIFKGECVGTLFHKEANQWASLIESGARELALAAKNASRRLQRLLPDERSKALIAVANALLANEKLIMAANEADLHAADLQKMEVSLIRRLKIKVSDFAESFRVLATMEDPVGKVLQRSEVSEGLILEKAYSPVGVVLVIFESRPDAVVQIASLAIRSGNGLLLKGGEDAPRSNAILHKVITEALPKFVGRELIGLVTSRDKIPDLLQMDDSIDLVIPRGGKVLNQIVKGPTRIPVLGYSDGVCSIYVDKAADIEMAANVVYDSKLDYPAAGNSMETLLIHESLVENKAWEPIFCRLQFAGVKMYGGPRAVAVLNMEDAKTLHKEYNAPACTVEIVKDLMTAVNHINVHGSAAIFRNASTRFCDGARFGLGAEVGISTSRLHARGPLGVEGLLTTRWLLRGNGQVVDGGKGVVFKHKKLPVDDVVPKLSAIKLTENGSILSNGNHIMDRA